MRTVSFSNPQLQQTLKNDFLCYYTDTTGDPTAGASFKHSPSDNPGPCGRGAGRQNVQTIFMTPDEEIFHVSSGFLSGEDLLTEAKVAKTIFDKLQTTSANKEKIVQDFQVARLKKQGFSQQQITQQSNPLTDSFLGGPNPQDFGMKLPTQFSRGRGNRTQSNFGTDLFGSIAKQRILKDAKYVLAKPLRSRESFEQDPGQLVGRHKSFFGTNSAMNGLGNMFDPKQQIQRVQRRK